MDPLTKFGIKLLLLFAGSVSLYLLGSHSGAKEVQLEWDLEKAGRDAVTSVLKERNKHLETESVRLSEENTERLKANEKAYQDALATARTEYDKRLRLSEGRAGIYRQQAEGSASERERLASHAAELDRTLEQGRSLVRELRETLGLRDSQIEALSNQIRTDRKLLEN